MSRLPLNVPTIRINPEHQRLIWLHFSPALLVGILMLYLLFSFAIVDPEIESSVFFTQISLVGNIGFGLSLTVLMLLLRNSIVNDLKSQYWDQLRMSSLSAWQMTWTRLFTAPILAWISLIIGASLAALGTYFSSPESADISLFIHWLMYFCAGFGIATLTLINYLQFNRSQKEWQGSLLQCLLLYVVLSIYTANMLSPLSNGGDDDPTLDFSALTANSLDPLLGFMLILCVFFGIGAWRSMSYKLHLKSSQHYWLFATLLLPIILWLYQSIWTVQNNLLFYMAYIYGCASLVSLSTQDNRHSTLGLGMRYLGEAKLKMALQTLPIWCVLLPAFILVSIFSVVIYSSASFGLYLSNIVFILVYATLVLSLVQAHQKFNAITLSLVLILVLRSLGFLVF